MDVLLFTAVELGSSSAPSSESRAESGELQW